MFTAALHILLLVEIFAEGLFPLHYNALVRQNAGRKPNSLGFSTYQHPSFDDSILDTILKLTVPIQLVVLKFPQFDFHSRPNILPWKVASQPGF